LTIIFNKKEKRLKVATNKEYKFFKKELNRAYKREKKLQKEVEWLSRELQN